MRLFLCFHTIGLAFAFQTTCRSRLRCTIPSTIASHSSDIYRRHRFIVEMTKGNKEPDEDDQIVIMGGSEDEDFSEELWKEAEAGQPSQWMVMKELLGINIFTYILAAAIVFFLSMNFILGPGWLGGAIGVKGTGSITQMSDSLPNSVDLSDPDYLL